MHTRGALGTNVRIRARVKAVNLLNLDNPEQQLVQLSRARLDYVDSQTMLLPEAQVVLQKTERAVGNILGCPAPTDAGAQFAQPIKHDETNRLHGRPDVDPKLSEAANKQGKEVPDQATPE